MRVIQWINGIFCFKKKKHTNFIYHNFVSIYVNSAKIILIKQKNIFTAIKNGHKSECCRFEQKPAIKVLVA